jgi:hypothetical protein
VHSTVKEGSLSVGAEDRDDPLLRRPGLLIVLIPSQRTTGAGKLSGRRANQQRTFGPPTRASR